MELLPCPFCGGTDLVVSKANQDTRHYPLLRCMKCYTQVEGNNLDSSSEGLTAVKRWNTRAATGWQDISSAPRDGTYILICQPEATLPNQNVVQWDKDWGCDGWWLVCDGKNWEIPLRGPAPTYWKPLDLPPPPTNKGDE